MCGFAVTDILWSSHLQVELLTEPLKAARRCLKPISQVSVGQAHGASHQRLSTSRHSRSEESKDWPQLGPWWHMWGTVTHGCPISWPLIGQWLSILASDWLTSREIWSPDISHRLHVMRKVKCPHWLTLASCLVTGWVILDLIGSLFQDWHPYTWMIAQVTRWKVEAPSHRSVWSTPCSASQNRDFSFFRPFLNL